MNIALSIIISIRSLLKRLTKCTIGLRYDNRINGYESNTYVSVLLILVSFHNDSVLPKLKCCSRLDGRPSCVQKP